MSTKTTRTASKTARTANQKGSKTVTTKTTKKAAPTLAAVAMIDNLASVPASPTLAQTTAAWNATGKSQARRDLYVSRYMTTRGKSIRNVASETGWSNGTIANAKGSGDLLDRMIAGNYTPDTRDGAMTAEVGRWTADRVASLAPKGYANLTGSALRDALRAMIEKGGKAHSKTKSKNASGARKSQSEKDLTPEKINGTDSLVPAKVKSATHEATDEEKAAAVLAVLPTIGSGVSLARARTIAEHASKILAAAEKREAAIQAKAEKAAKAAQAKADAEADEAAVAATA